MGGSLKVGNVDILSLTDAESDFPVPLDQLYPGTNLDQWRPFYDRYPETFGGPDKWHSHWGCHLIRSQGRTILVDTGIGPNPPALLGGRPGRLPEELKANGISPEEIDTVFITHGHPDHVAWNLVDGTAARFPRARYVMHRDEWEGLEKLDAIFVQVANTTYIHQTATPLRGLGVLDLLDGEKALTDEVTAIPTPGHTPGHMSLIVSSGGERACITGDVIVHPAMITEPDWAFGFDFEADKARESRKALLERIEAEALTIVGCHFPSPGYGRIVRLEGRRYWQSL